MKLFIFFYILCCFQFSLANDNEIIIHLKMEAPIKSNNYLIAIYQNTGSCSKCYFKPMNQIEKVFSKVKNSDNLKLLAFVECKRKKDLLLFKERYNWQNEFAIVDNGNIKKTLGIPQNSQITVFNDKYDIIINITDENLHLADSLIYEKIKS